MKLGLNIILILVAVFTVYVEDIYLYLNPVLPQHPVAVTIRAGHAFTFDQEKVLHEKRALALSQYIPLFTFIPENLETSKTKMVRLIMKVYTLQSSGKASSEELSTYIEEEFDYKLDKQTVARLVRYKDLVKLLSGILTVEESILQRKIIEDAELIKNKNSIQVLYSDSGRIATQSSGEIVDIEEAERLLKEKTSSLFWQVDKRILDPIMQISLSSLQPNLIYDKEENDRRIENIVDQYPSTMLNIKPGDVLIPFGKVSEEEDLLLLNTYFDVKNNHFYKTLAWKLTVIFFVILFFNLFVIQILRLKKDGLKLTMMLLIIIPLLLKSGMLFTSMTAYVLPFSLLPLLLLLLNQEKITVLCATLVGAMLISLFAGPTFEIFLFFAFGGIAAVLLFPKVSKRWQIFLPALSVGAVNAIVAAATIMDINSISELYRNNQTESLAAFSGMLPLFYPDVIGKAFMGGLIAGPLAILFLPFLEMSTKATSLFKLNRFADLQHPLMKDLLSKSPGTYQHTMAVANLSQAAGEVVYANTLLLRIGAYYHDMGKVMNPKFFTENQFTGKNSHDDLIPEESAAIIINHVKEGKMIARGAGLPQAVMDLISQHHGTQLVEYFYNKAVKAADGLGLVESEFRYPGPKPQTIEAAILMIADFTEAATRTLDDPTRGKIEQMVRRLIQHRMSDGQFDECDLTTRQLSRIISAIVDTLQASLHSRVKYPWQEKEEKKLKARTIKKATR